MSDSNDNEQTPKNVDQLLQQVEASITKEKLNALKGELTSLVKKRDEAKRSVATIQAEIDEKIAKFKAGL